MFASYPACYRDSFGIEETSIHNDGKTLSMSVRGVAFEGPGLDRLAPTRGPDSARLSSFTFLHGSLCFCVIETDIPLPVVTPRGTVDGILKVDLQLCLPLPTGQMNRERLKLQLNVEEVSYSSGVKTGFFDGEMGDLQRQLPTGTFMKVCFSCAFADYSPDGHGLFGNMICFRANKEGYLALPSDEDFCKDSYFDVMDTVTEMVQETFLCLEFEKRTPGAGYRG